jgi:hypothetical protein
MTEPLRVQIMLLPAGPHRGMESRSEPMSHAGRARTHRARKLEIEEADADDRGLRADWQRPLVCDQSLQNSKARPRFQHESFTG